MRVLQMTKLWRPDNLGVICPAFVECEIPIGRVAEAPGMPVEKEELCAPRVEVAVDDSDPLTTASWENSA